MNSQGFASKAFNATEHKRRKFIISYLHVLFVHLCGTETLLVGLLRQSVLQQMSFESFVLTTILHRAPDV